jgi:hypothetical protein
MIRSDEAFLRNMLLQRIGSPPLLSPRPLLRFYDCVKSLVPYNFPGRLGRFSMACPAIAGRERIGMNKRSKRRAFLSRRRGAFAPGGKRLTLVQRDGRSHLSPPGTRLDGCDRIPCATAATTVFDSRNPRRLLGCGDRAEKSRTHLTRRRKCS